MRIADERFKLENIKQSIINGEDFKFSLSRDVYIKIGLDFINLINKESWFLYSIEIKSINYGSEFSFNCSKQQEEED